MPIKPASSKSATGRSGSSIGSSKFRYSLGITGLVLVVPLLIASMWKQGVSLDLSVLSTIETTILSTQTPTAVPDTQKTTTSTPNLRLQVSFYIYEGDLDWEAGGSYGNLYKTNRTASKTLNYTLAESTYLNYKHSDDYWFLQAAKQHPLRTRDPTQAQLFLVPILLNALSSHLSAAKIHPKSNYHLCVGQRCNRQLLLHADSTLAASPWFQQSQGRNHIIIDSHFHKASWDMLPKNNTLFQCNQVSFEQQRPLPLPKDRINLPSLYVGQACTTTPGRIFRKTSNFAMIADLKVGARNFLTRRNICRWLKIEQQKQDKQASGSNNKSKEQMKHYSVCGTGKQCPALAQARFGFHARGDTWGSNRLIDTLRSRTVPLFTSPMQFTVLPTHILPDHISWHDLGYLVDMSSRPAFEESLTYILSKVQDDTDTHYVYSTSKHNYYDGAADEMGYQYKQHQIAKCLPYLDHTQIYQFDAYMTRFATLLKLQKGTSTLHAKRAMHDA